MKQYIIYTCIFIFFPLNCISGNNNMKDIEIDLRSHVFKISSMPSINELKLIEINNYINLVFSSKQGSYRKLYTIPFKNNTSSPELLLQLPEFPLEYQEWDIFMKSDNFFDIVYTAGINFNSLRYQTKLKRHSKLKTENEYYVNKKYSYQNFIQPKLIKNNNAEISFISAIIKSENKSQLVLFSLNEKNNDYQKIIDCESGILIKQKEGYILCYKLNIPGPARKTPWSKSGVLNCVYLDSQFKLINKSLFQPLSNICIYDFDVFMFKDYLFITASCEAGLYFVVVKKIEKTFKLLNLIVKQSETVLCCPAIYSKNEKIFIALIEYNKKNIPEILTGTILHNTIINQKQ